MVLQELAEGHWHHSLTLCLVDAGQGEQRRLPPVLPVHLQQSSITEQVNG